jgi:hypothetical protein
MISERFGEMLGEQVLPVERWHPYPTAVERDGWDGLPNSIRAALVTEGEGCLGYAWPFLPATGIMEFARSGDRLRFENLYIRRRTALTALVLAECAEGKGRFLDEIVNGLWGICEETSWSLPAHLNSPTRSGGLPDPAQPVVDLFAAETAALLAWTSYLLGRRLDGVSDLIVPRLLAAVDERILAPALARNDFFWQGYGQKRPNNWNPWVISNWLACILLVERDGARRTAALRKAVQCLDLFINPHPADGGCDEGPMYWGHAGASLFDCLELLRSASGGVIDLYDQPLIGEIGTYPLRVHIAGSWFVNFADALPLSRPPSHAVAGYGRRTGRPELESFGAWLAQRPAIGGTRAMDNLARSLYALFDTGANAPKASTPPLLRDAWLPVIEVMTARDRAGDSGGFFVAAKGGHNDESHNHNDVGAFVVFRDGNPLLVDAGVGEYRRQTFSRERYTIWTMQSAYHNGLPSFDGVQQQAGEEFSSRDVRYAADDERAELSLDIAAAYPAAAGVTRWRRCVRLERGQRVVVEDAYELAQSPKQIEFCLLTPSDVTLRENGVVELVGRELSDGRPSAAGEIRIAAPGLALTVERIPIDDVHMSPAWGDHLNRILVRLTAPPFAGTVRLTIT